MEKYIQSVQGFIPETEKADRAAIKKVLTYREGGKHSIWIKGTMRQEIACMIQLLIHMKEDNVNKQLKYLEKRNKKVDEHVRTVSNPERRSTPFSEESTWRCN